MNAAILPVKKNTEGKDTVERHGEHMTAAQLYDEWQFLKKQMGIAQQHIDEATSDLTDYTQRADKLAGLYLELTQPPKWAVVKT